MKGVTTMSVMTEDPTVATEIRPFTFDFSKKDIEDLKARVAATRWPEKEPVDDATQGVQLKTVQALAKYWANEYDFGKLEAKLKALPHFITEIDGLDIHFVHVRSKHENALPLLVAHGWPGSFIELLKLVGPLTDPTAHGGKAEDAFHLVIPSMPGYGFSAKPSTPGWTPERIARAYAELMERLGYEKYAAQGGDWGALVVEFMAVQEPAGLLGIHTNMARVVPSEIDGAAFTGAKAPEGLTAEEKSSFDQLAFFYAKGLGYAIEMKQRPQTLYGIADSPIGLAAWTLDHDWRSMLMKSRVFDGVAEGLTRDDILDNITLYWLTNTAISAGRLYAEYNGAFFAPAGVKLPVAVSAFVDEIYFAPKSWAEKAYPKLIYYKKREKGGHFAAWEQPASMVEDIREGLRSLR